MDNPFKSPVIISFCTGGRMLESGLGRAIGHFTVAAYVEIEAFCVYNLVAQMEQGVVDPAPVWSDAKTFPSSGFHRKVHGIIGGYPCQPFSLAGKRLGETDPRHIWPYLRTHIAAIRPVWCFFENVDDHLTMGFDTVYKELRALGYAVEAGVYSAQEVGAPHERQRLFILAIADSIKWGVSEYEGAKGIEVNGCGESLADCVGQGLAGWQEQHARHQFTTTKRGGGQSELPDTLCNDEREIQVEKGNPKQRSKPFGNGYSRRVNQWPAGKGTDQHAWEHPRTTQSGVGCTVDGYNFREDLLRMLGNGVVEQTAEIAMIDLLKKHGLLHLINH